MEAGMEQCGGVDFEKVVNKSPIASFIWLRSDEECPCFVSEGIRAFGYDPSDFTSGRVRFEDLVHPEDRDSLSFVPDATPKGYRLKNPQGGWRWVLHRVCVIEGGCDMPEEILWLVSDITAHMEIHSELQRNESKLAAFTNALPAMLLVLDEDGRFIEVSGSSEGVETVSKYIGKTVRESLPDEKAEELMAPLERCFETGAHQTAAYEIGGKRYFQETHISLMPETFDGKRAVVCVAIDITARKELEEQILLQSVHNPLDMASNRTRFNRALFLALAEAQRTGSPLALFHIDLDKFNRVNEAIGREMADLLLKGVAQRLQGACRREDIIYRMEGVNYYVILPKPGTKEDISAIADRMLNAIKSAAPQQSSFTLTATIGISVFPTDGQDSKGLLRVAEQALSAGKEAGGDCYRFYEPEA